VGYPQFDVSVDVDKSEPAIVVSTPASWLDCVRNLGLDASKYAGNSSKKARLGGPTG